MTTTLPSAGWYPDPERPHEWRYWDGQSWTEHRAPRRLPSPVAVAAPVAAPRPRRSPVPMALAGTGLVLAALIGVGAAGTVLTSGAGGSGDSTRTVSAPASTAAATTRPAPTPTASAAPTPSATSTPPATATTAPSAEPTATTPSAAKRATPTAKPAAKPAGALVAVAGVTDGDTIKVRLGGTTERVRVIGIDTPELSPRECYAQQAASKMQSLVQSKQVRLVKDPTQADRDRYGRLLRHVFLTDGRSAAQVLIAGGYGEEYTYAKAYAGQSAYRAAERSARAAGKGIWSSGCRAATAKPSTTKPSTTKPSTTKPSTTKPSTTKPSTTKPSTSGSCTIKGNIASDGEKIYHVPGQQFYGVTKIDLGKGERWFCSESDAVRAGWRKSKV